MVPASSPPYLTLYLTLPAGWMTVNSRPALWPQHRPQVQPWQTSSSVEPLRGLGKLAEEYCLQKCSSRVALRYCSEQLSGQLYTLPIDRRRPMSVVTSRAYTMMATRYTMMATNHEGHNHDGHKVYHEGQSKKRENQRRTFKKSPNSQHCWTHFTLVIIVLNIQL